MPDPFSPDWFGQSAPWSYWPSSLLGVTPIARQDARERAGGTPNDAWDRATPAWLRSAMPPLGSGGLQGAFAQADGAAGQDSFVASPASTSPGTGRGILPFGDRWVDPQSFGTRGAPAWLPSAAVAAPVGPSWPPHPTVWPSAPGAAGAPAPAGGVDWRSLASQAVEPITSYWPTYTQMNRDAREQVAHGIEQVRAAYEPGVHDPIGFIKGLGNVGLGSYGYVTSPIGAAFRTIAGKPIENATGIPKEYTEFGLTLATPFLGLRGSAPARPVVPVDRTIANSRTIQFDPTTVAEGLPLGSGQTVMTGNARGLDDAFRRTNPLAYELSPKKMARLNEFVEEGKAVSLPEVVAESGQIRFVNGRHRARLAAQQDVTDLPIAVNKGNQPAIDALIEKARMARAKELGFDTDTPLAYGSAPDAPVILSDATRGGGARSATATPHGVFAEAHPYPGGIADASALAEARQTGGNPQVTPLRYRVDRPGSIALTGNEKDPEIAAALADAWARGHDSMLLRNYATPGGVKGDLMVVKDPAQWRSPFAQFDPAKRHLNDLLAGFGGLAALPPAVAASMMRLAGVDAGLGLLPREQGQ
jgi:hypothetical protein